MADLMQLPAHVLAKAKLAARLKRRGHAGQPGAGPEGETCKSCRWIEGVWGGNKRFSKCSHHLAPRRTGGPGTDIRQRDPACERWEAASGAENGASVGASSDGR